MVCVAAFVAPAACIGNPKALPDVAQLWMAKSGGIWREGERYGYYKVLVYREGTEPAQDRVLIHVTQVQSPAQNQQVIRSVWLDTPGVKGYIADIGFKVIDGTRMALTLDISMKGMDGLTLREVYVLHPDGTYRLVQPANQLDIYK